MVFSQIGFTSLLRSLGLAQGLLKPAPGALDPNAPQQSLSTQATTLPQTSLNAFAATLHDSPASVEVLDSGDCYVQNYTGPSLIDSYSPFDPVKATIYRYRQQQSVNLGSWFVHEQWMTPSTFKCSSGKQLSEHDIASGWGSTTAARAVLERHWDSFISQEDFYYLASIGINTVRIPIGYWSLGPTYCRDTAFADVAEVYANSWSRVKHAIIMADQAGLGVLVDLHGAPGSQNGQPHSGISDGQTTLFADPSNVEKTMQILTFLAGELSEVTNVVGVQILNEPKNVDSLEDFYTEAIIRIRNVSSAAEALPLYIHDGFDLTRFSRYVGNRSDFVVQDHHSYFVYTSADENETASDHATDVRSTVLNDLDYASRTGHRNLVVDEWSCALAPQSLAEESDKGGAQQRFCTDQSIAYSSAVAGWGFWAYMKEDCDSDPGWCFRAAVGNYLPPTFPSYPADSRQPTLDGEPALLVASRRRLSTHQVALDSTQSGHNKGYSDGFQTALVFASYGMSRLGFVDQYIMDSLSSLAPTQVVSGEEESYREWFMRGLEDGEATILPNMDGNSY